MSARFGWTSSIGRGMQLMLRRRAALLGDDRYWVDRTRAIQIAQLRRNIGASSRTRLGLEHNFSRMLDRSDEGLLEHFRDAIPFGDYEAWREPFREMREEAACDVTWPGVVEDWAQTSGTTGGEKFIPVSREMTRSNRKAAFDIFAHSMRFGVSLPALFGGKLLFLGGSTDVSTNERGIRTGDLSGLAARTIHWPLTRVYSPGLDIALMSDWPAKIESMARRCMEQDVRMVSGMASWALVVFSRMIELAQESGRDVTTLKEIWPNLELFVHGGVRYQPFDPRVRRAWSGSDDCDDPASDIPTRLEVYPASEGFFAMQDTAGDPGLRLSTDIGLFFEFVPLESWGDDNAPVLLCDEVEPGVRYVLNVSSCAGLWRYTVGDVVVFDTVPPDGPARLRIVGRHRHFINAFGENLIVEQIENAVAEAQRRTGASIGEFTAAPVYPGADTRAGLELAIEWQSDDTRSAGAFCEAFDESLKQQNVDYTTKRTESLGMDEPRLTMLRPGTFHRWMDATGKLGGQHKMPRCANSREIIEEVIRVGAS